MAKSVLRLFSWVTLAAVLATSLFAASPAPQGEKGTKYWVFFGTYTGAKPGAAGKSSGIYRSEFDTSTGKLTEPVLAAEAVDPSFLAIDPAKKHLYCVVEQDYLPTGGVNAYNLDTATGKLTFLNKESSGGQAPCYIAVDRTGKYVFASNHHTGSDICLPIQTDGSLGKPTSFIQHNGPIDPKGKDSVHSHSINVDAGNHYVVAAEKGLNQLIVYKFDATKGTLTPNDPPYLQLPPNTAPRHFAFHPNGKFAYVINERALTINAMSYDPDKGVLKSLQSIPTNPKGTKAGSTAEVVVHPSGKFLYGSNRGPNTIAIYSINQQTGELKSVGWQGKDIKTPRNFAIDPTGKFMLVANQGSGNVIEFHIDPNTGELAPTDVRVNVMTPVCVRFVEMTK